MHKLLIEIKCTTLADEKRKVIRNTYELKHHHTRIILIMIRLYASTSERKKETKMKYKFTASLNKELVEELKIQAIKEHRSVSSILEQLITDYLNDIN